MIPTIPKASISATTVVKPGFLRSVRTA